MVTACRPAGQLDGTPTDRVTWPLASGNSGSSIGLLVTPDAGSPITRVVTPSMIELVLRTSSTTSALPPGTMSSRSVSAATSMALGGPGRDRRGERLDPLHARRRVGPGADVQGGGEHDLERRAHRALDR